ncbi:alpha-1,2-mannosyltransferase [Hymenopellis radicata]|nr:alpha-1,2-mannosyltransferase [Hymenopellis radicata]
MNTAARYILLILGVVITIHYTLTLLHEPYGRAAKDFFSSPDVDPTSVPLEYYVPPDSESLIAGEDLESIIPGNTTARANAAFVILARNSDIDNTVRSIREMEERFNRRFGYPYVVLNEVEFTEEFKERVSVLTSAKMEFGVIPPEHWYQPDWIDEDRAAKARADMVKDGIIYAGSVAYRNMCRFNSGFFFKHPLLLPYRWYWRIEPDVHFHCDMQYDPFVFMEQNKKVYGFTITMYEFEKTIPTLWGHVKEFMRLHPEHVVKDNAMNFQSGDGGETYNLCHFWSNFEIADMEFWRGAAYQDFFAYLEKQGGFYYERWGDAPVHSIAANIFASKQQVHFFDDIGYEHNPYTHCPRDEAVWRAGRCSCDRARSFDYDGYSCLSKWDRLVGERGR